MNKILIVEDNQDDIELILMVLENMKIVNEIDIARDGREALDYLACRGRYSGPNRKEMPTLVLLDLKLPKVSGHEVLESIRSDEKTRFLPVVIFTSSKEEYDITKSYKGGANSYIRKPVDPDQFDKAIRNLHLYWTLLNEPPPKTDKI